MDFSAILICLKMGGRVAREGWNGKGMWLELASQGTYLDALGFHQPISLPFIVMRTAQGDFVPWLASQTDILATDWAEILNHHTTPPTGDA